MKQDRIILGIDPGLANTGWGVVHQQGPRRAATIKAAHAAAYLTLLSVHRYYSSL